MKRGIIVLLLLGILLVSPLVLAQEQDQIQEQMETYSGFNRFIDNVKLIFSGGDNKVKLVLEIREKEVNSAIVNTKNGEDEEAEKNLERAWKRLQLIQKKVSFDTAEEVKENSEEVRMMISQEEGLSNDFEVYVLEEEKTGLTAEWIMEFEGEEGQNLTREVVINTKQNRVVEIENRIDEIDGEISNWVVENSVGEDGEGDDGLIWEVKNEIAGGDEGLKPEVKTYVAGDGTLKNEVVEEGNGGYASGTSGGGASGDSSDGDCGEGVVCGGEEDVIEDGAGDDVIDGGEGTPGTNEIGPQ